MPLFHYIFVAKFGKQLRQYTIGFDMCFFNVLSLLALAQFHNSFFFCHIILYFFITCFISRTMW